MSFAPATPPSRGLQTVFTSPGCESVSSSSASVTSDQTNSTTATSPGPLMQSPTTPQDGATSRPSTPRSLTSFELAALPPHVINKMSTDEVRDVLEEVKSRIIEKVEAEERLRRADAAYKQIFPIQQSFQAGFVQLDKVKQDLVHRTFESLPAFIGAC
ncbi:hypothetical protein BKA70DRAFT_1235306 [Coprinopsis sp. MPI-PUGE-AT-0042]|nr:hypothetical protein BKA70DRAFT_1235306 [Coprinopsis sp. MPI-PUGE-AT-0042]